MTKRALVTGVNGFVGRYLANELSSNGCVVFGIDLQKTTDLSDIIYSQTDISTPHSLGSFLERTSFDEIYHLAAVANPRQAKQYPESAFQVSFNSTLDLLEACRQYKETRVLFVGSSEQYKKSNLEEIYHDEKDELDTISIYGTTKVICEQMASSYFHQFGIFTSFTRSFNHTGPGQAPLYVMSEFAKQVAEIKKGVRKEEIFTGNIDLYRDFLDVRDVVKAYASILTNGKPGEAYNVCSGKPVSLKYCLEYLVDYAGLNNVKLLIDQEKYRANEPKTIYGNPDKIFQHTGWRAEIAIQKTLQDLLDYWLKNV